MFTDLQKYSNKSRRVDWSGRYVPDDLGTPTYNSKPCVDRLSSEERDSLDVKLNQSGKLWDLLAQQVEKFINC